MNKNEVNVLAVVTAMEAGGLETYLVNTLSAIDRHRFKVTIACTGRDSNWFADDLARLGVKTVFCPNPYSQVGYVYRIGKVIRDLGIDVVCDFRDDFSAPTLWAAARAGVRSRIAMYRSSQWNFRPDLLRNAYVGLMHRCTQRWATRIIGNSRKVLDSFYPGWPAQEKFAVICNGVDLDKFQPQRDGGEIRKELGIPENRTVIGHVGRFHRAKNHAVILKSFARLRAEMNNVHLLLVGDGDLRDEIERAIRELEIEDRVTLAGRRKNVPAVLGAMDVYFFPSMYEGMPNALIEAMACGLPIVASDIEEVLEVVPGEMRQQLLAPTDFEGLAGALKRLCLDLEARKELGALARRHVEQHFSLQVSAEKLCRYWTMDL